MARFSRVGALRLGAAPFLVFASVSALTLGLAHVSGADAALPCRDGGPGCISIGFTDAWFGGQTVQLEYSHRYFCAQSPSGDVSSECEAGKAAATQPPSGPVVSNVYLL